MQQPYKRISVHIKNIIEVLQSISGTMRSKADIRDRMLLRV